MITFKKIAELKKEIQNKYDEYENVALRIVADDYDEYNFKKGEYLPQSRRWIDGEYTEDYVGGTCGLCLKKISDNYGMSSGGYSGDRIFVITGNFFDTGEDVNEIILSNSVVIDVIEMED